MKNYSPKHLGVHLKHLLYYGRQNIPYFKTHFVILQVVGMNLNFKKLILIRYSDYGVAEVENHAINPKGGKMMWK